MKEVGNPSRNRWLGGKRLTVHGSNWQFLQDVLPTDMATTMTPGPARFLTDSLVSVLFSTMLLTLPACINLDKELSGYDQCREFLDWRAAVYRDGATFGTKTAYLFDTPRPGNETTLGGCTAVQVDGCIVSNCLTTLLVFPVISDSTTCC